MIKYLPIFTVHANAVQILLTTTFSCHFAPSILQLPLTPLILCFSWCYCIIIFSVSVGFRVLGNLQLCVNSRLGGKSSSMYQLPDGSISRHTHTPPYKTTESISKPIPLSNHTHNHFYPHHKSGTHRAARVKTNLCSLAVCVSCLKIICPQDSRKKMLS